jgi:preprotein translocase subunit SecD
MKQSYVKLILILLLLAVVVWIDLPNNPGIHLGNTDRNLDTVLGLDLQGGLQVLLEADLPEDAEINPTDMQNARQILENRSNGLGVSEVTFQVAGTRRIVGEFPGLENTDEVIAVLKETGQLEFVDTGDLAFPPNTEIYTDLNGQPLTQPDDLSGETPAVYHTVITGSNLTDVYVTQSQLGEYLVAFELDAEGSKVFAEHTANNVQKVLAIVMDNKVISSPTIQTAITGGEGTISGDFTVDSANNLAIQLRYGSLPIPFKVVESRLVGPTLGEDSLNKSLIAGLAGLIIITLFMVIYYRLPGAVAMLSIATYGAITLALFKFIPVTLTLPGIAGLMLSTGGALDANILIFERLKEELRSGRRLGQAVKLAWQRAWPSIRDSNLATLITSLILFWFGSAFGASTVKGFAVTLAIGVAVSLFCAIFITRTYLDIALQLINTTDHEKNVKRFGAG